MTKSFALAAALLAFAPGLALAAGPGGSQPRAWVSGTGADVSGCGTIKAPCRTFQYAHDAIVTPGGTIYVQDAANYVGTAPFVITHAISIINDGVGPATIVAPGADAIDVQAGTSDAVFLKGLILDGAGSGNNGVHLTTAGSLTVANCTIKGFAYANSLATGNGILIAPTSGAVNFSIFDTVVSGNGDVGIYIDAGSTVASGGSATGTVKNVNSSNNKFGLAINEEVITASTTVTVVDSVFSQNVYGLDIGNGSLNVSNSVATGNSIYDVYQFSGVITSYQNNIFNTTFNSTGRPIVKGGLQ